MMEHQHAEARLKQSYTGRETREYSDYVFRYNATTQFAAMLEWGCKRWDEITAGIPGSLSGCP